MSPISEQIERIVRKPYQYMIGRMPAAIAGPVSDLAFRLKGRPYVYRDRHHPPEGLRRGIVTISIDFEMAWATRYSKTSEEDIVARGMRERAQIPEILSALNEYEIPATWATVGHLFLKECRRGVSGHAHPEIPRCGHFENRYWRFTEGDWFQHDPCTDVRRDPAWYAPDIIEAILSSRTQHEIGCHSFSHIGFGPYCPEEVCRGELDACLDAMKEFNLGPSSYVFPGNEPGHIGIIAQKGFSAVRTFPVSRAEISLPVDGESGIRFVHSSASIDTHLLNFNPARRLARLRAYIDRAAETRLAAHLWFHPGLPPSQIRSLLLPIIRYCAEMRNSGRIACLTMEELARTVTSPPTGSGHGGAGA